jgi:hypothetical protein
MDGGSYPLRTRIKINTLWRSLLVAGGKKTDGRKARTTRITPGGTIALQSKHELMAFEPKPKPKAKE